MLVRCWGARGSVPVSGPEYIRYGGSTTCMEVRSTTGHVLIVDAGTGLRDLGNQLNKETQKNFTLLFTHTHLDHIIGFPYFKPLYDKTCSLNIYSCPLAQGTVQRQISALMSSPYFPISLTELPAKLTWKDAIPTNTTTDLHGVRIQTIPLTHPGMGIGYKFSENNRSFVFLTDNELDYPHAGGKSFAEYTAWCQGADLLIHDAEYTESEYPQTKGWGHSTWRRALELALEAGVSQFGLFHHNQDRTDAALDAIVKECQEIIARRQSSMHCFAMKQGTEIHLG